MIFLKRKIKMIEEKYIPLLLSHQIGGITTIGDTQSLGTSKTETQE